MAARKTLKNRVKELLTRKARERFRNGVTVHVEDAGYRDYLDVFVITKGFGRMDLLKRTSLVFDWLEEELKPSEVGKITKLGPFTPAEERRMFGVGR